MADLEKSAFLKGFEPRPSRQQLVCAECLRRFSVKRRQIGRPGKFCSPECRSASKRRQIRRWALDNPAASPVAELVCRGCSATFAVEPRSCGRVPHYCSPKCRNRPEGPKRDPPMFDQRDLFE